MPLQAPLALLGPPALEAWLCSRVSAGTAGAPVGADGGRSAPRAGREECANGALAAQEVRVVCWLHALPSAKNLLLSTGRLLRNHKTVYFSPNINRVATSHLAVDLTREYSGVSGRPTAELLRKALIAEPLSAAAAVAESLLRSAALGPALDMYVRTSSSCGYLRRVQL